MASNLRKLSKDNALTIVDYIHSMKSEINLSDNYRRLNIYALYRLSRFFNNRKQLCVRFGDWIDISADECDRYAHGTELTQEGGYFFVCNLITRVGPTLLAAAIGGGAGGLAASGVGGFLAELC